MTTNPESNEPGDQPASAPPEKEPERYHEKTTVNGVEIQIGWSDTDMEYTLLLPQLRKDDGSMTAEASKASIFSPDVRTASDDSEIARRVFAHAVSLAHQETDPTRLFKQIDDYVSRILEGGEKPEGAE